MTGEFLDKMLKNLCKNHYGINFWIKKWQHKIRIKRWQKNCKMEKKVLVEKIGGIYNYFKKLRNKTLN